MYPGPPLKVPKSTETKTFSYPTFSLRAMVGLGINLENLLPPPPEPWHSIYSDSYGYVIKLYHIQGPDFRRDVGYRSTRGPAYSHKRWVLGKRPKSWFWHLLRNHAGASGIVVRSTLEVYPTRVSLLNRLGIKDDRDCVRARHRLN